ncbi:MAG TPA: AraC family transcriptional regulator [Pyrinomonadaceae bacterium]|nr:AraC family transcriptional regulator [Pyrinomonadaceae bacterium]
MALKFISGHFPTKVTRSREVAGFILTETSYASNQKLSRHFHEHANFIIVLRGTFTEHFGRKTRWCEPSSLIFRPPGELHADHFHEAGGSCLTIEIPTKWWERRHEYLTPLKDSADFRNDILTTTTARLYGEFRRTDSSSSLAIEGLTLEMIAEVSRLNVKKSSLPSEGRVERAREIIHAHFSEHLTLSLIAEAVGAHPVYLAREFRHRYHCTVGEYVRRLRIQSACREMASSDATIAEIASAAGFFDQSHFSRTFKRLTGTTPAEYRKNIRPR